MFLIVFDNIIVGLHDVSGVCSTKIYADTLGITLYFQATVLILKLRF